MGLFDGFPFVSKEERERRSRDFENRIAPFGLEEQRNKLKVTLVDLFPGIDITDLMFVYFDAKDSYTLKENSEDGVRSARFKLSKVKWMDKRKETIMLRLIELERGLTSLDDYPTANDVLAGLFEE